jgi:hypothetical protein
MSKVVALHKLANVMKIMAMIPERRSYSHDCSLRYEIGYHFFSTIEIERLYHQLRLNPLDPFVVRRSSCKHRADDLGCPV